MILSLVLMNWIEGRKKEKERKSDSWKKKKKKKKKKEEESCLVCPHVSSTLASILP